MKLLVAFILSLSLNSSFGSVEVRDPDGMCGELYKEYVLGEDVYVAIQYDETSYGMFHKNDVVYYKDGESCIDIDGEKNGNSK